MNQTPMTAQEIFDKVLIHLRTQGVAAKEGQSCQYLTYDGRMCAVGCLLTHEVAEQAYGSVGTLRLEQPDIYRLLDPFEKHFELLEALQNSHDSYMEPRDPFKSVSLPTWEEDMQEIARAHGLVYVPRLGPHQEPKTNPTDNDDVLAIALGIAFSEGVTVGIDPGFDPQVGAQA